MRLTDRLFAVGLFVVFLKAYHTALSYPPASANYPKMLLTVGMVLCVGMFIQSFFAAQQKGTSIAKRDLINLFISLGLMTLYVAAIPVVGYIVSTFVYMMAQMWVLNRKSKIWVNFLIVAAIIAVIYVAFGIFLNVFLPKGILM